MTALLTDNLPLLAGAPNGIKKLRELILELAVRGKLVPQDPSDEPASELLKRIAEEKARLVAEGKIKKQKLLGAIAEDEKPYELPVSWDWVRLPEIYYSVSVSGNKLLSSQINEEGVFPVIDQGKRFVAGYTDDESLLIRLPGPVVVFGDHTTERKYVDFDFVAGADGVKILRPILLDEKFFWWHLVGLKLEGRGYARHFKVLNDALFALPPKGEQSRIVAKVDLLMALCDQLEAQQADADSAHTQLVQALLDSLTQARDAEDFTQSWQRLAEHFHTLFTTESSIDALKQTLLQLAVMGKLVPQDPSDEPASELLKRIAEKKATLIAEGKIRKQKQLAEITEEEKLFELATGWEWSRLGEQVIESGAGWSPSCEPRPREGNDWGVLKVSAVSWGVYRPEENKALPVSLEARPEHEVAEGDFLVSRANTAELVARSVVVDSTPSRLMLSDKIVRLRLTKLCDAHYLNLVNSATHARQYYARVAGGTSSSMKNVSREQILSLPIAVPPLPEQHRIVAKVDQLMAFCDRLKARLNQARQVHEQLANALVEQAVA